MTLVKAAGLDFIAVFAAGFVLGTIRVLWVIPHLGERTAELVEVPIMLVVIVASARGTDRRFLGTARAGERLLVGVAALVLLLAAEIALAMILRGASVWQALFDRDPVSGTAYYVALAIFAILPWWLGRRANPASGRSE
ncbi:MAG: hypothetical protein KGN76_09485 [Acidobacteriota bacterium]|nr:hypothetical protein [Acidobacteriota bacterium]